ncbi:putative periplasmic ligand-binding sensor domain protein [Hoeflea phototrophica DFL-43]|uniref:Adenylate cyclase n=1 Tax=Hoeflea phototrophica (strain DSM 17068 / NCIMB 14078 / DFL-43) TaxID=411684 RepID=A9CZ99_HOEPD|nr:adenylate/guanylate cyclase domain-containing protein [Hoeflea phototrophica]EDQ34730.1 putative periplasmic ligand-binding sensor domain protein [Hoeflea phototrophica DFL-43]
MDLRQKTFALILTTFVVSAIALLYFASSITLAGYQTIEREKANQDLQRLEKVFVADLMRRFATLEDFSSWDDTYDFVETGDPDYVESNFTSATFSVPGIEFVVIVDPLGQTVHASAHGVPDDMAAPVLAGLSEALNVEGDLFEEHPSEYGLITIASSTLMIAMAPILRSNDSGPPRGVMLAGKMLDDQEINNLSLKTQLNINYENLALTDPGDVSEAGFQPSIQEMTADGLSLLRPPHLIHPVNDERLAGYILMPDITGNPILLWSVLIPRDIYQRGKDSLNVLLLALVAIGVVLTLCILLLLERLVLRRVARLGDQVTDIGQKDDPSMRVHVDGKDELGRLGTTVNWMLNQLQLSRQKVVEEHERAESLLLNILPTRIAEQLKTTSEPIADSHSGVSVLFADLAGFTPLSARMDPVELVSMLNSIFSQFDELTQDLQLEKIKTIGDAYMVAAGLPEPRTDHAQAIADMALGMIKATETFSEQHSVPLQIRVGINSGVVVAGVIGKKKFIYDLWGDTVNIASRMESSGETGMIQVTESTYLELKDMFVLEERGLIDIKGRGKMRTYILKGRAG